MLFWCIVNNEWLRIVLQNNEQDENSGEKHERSEGRGDQRGMSSSCSSGQKNLTGIRPTLAKWCATISEVGTSACFSWCIAQISLYLLIGLSCQCRHLLVTWMWQGDDMGDTVHCNILSEAMSEAQGPLSSKRELFTRCCFHVGPTSKTAGQHENNFG